MIFNLQNWPFKYVQNHWPLDIWPWYLVKNYPNTYPVQLSYICIHTCMLVQKATKIVHFHILRANDLRSLTHWPWNSMNDNPHISTCNFLMHMLKYKNIMVFRKNGHFSTSQFSHVGFWIDLKSNKTWSGLGT